MTTIGREYSFTRKKDAKAVLSAMKDIINMYGEVNLLDVHTLIGIPTHHTDVKVVWSSTEKMQIVKDDSNKRVWALRLGPANHEGE